MLLSHSILLVSMVFTTELLNSIESSSWGGIFALGFTFFTTDVVSRFKSLDAQNQGFCLVKNNPPQLSTVNEEKLLHFHPASQKYFYIERAGC